MKTIIAFLIGLLLTAVAWADVNEWTTIQGMLCSGSRSVGTSGVACFQFNSSLSDTTQSFNSQNSQALACLVVNDSTGADATVYGCPYGLPNDSATFSDHCIEKAPTGGNPLTGTGGTPATQRGCVSVGRGVHGVEFTAPSAGTAIFTVGEGQ